MRRTMLTLVALFAVVVGAGMVNPQTAHAGPGYFSFSIGAPAYYPYGYPAYGAYPYPGPAAAQVYVGAGVPVGAPYVYPRYGAYRAYGRPMYAPYGFARPYRW